MTVSALTRRLCMTLGIALAAASCDSDPTPPAREKPSTADTTEDEKVCTFDGAASVRSQVSLDAVCGCTRVDGDLSIDASRVSDLRCLSSLREVTGKLTVAAPIGASGVAVTDLTVFADLRAVGELSLNGLPQIRDLHGLERVTWTELSMENNAELRSLDGLAVPAAITKVTLADNPKLESLEALRAARAIATVQLTRLAALGSLDGLEGEIDSFRLTQSDGLTDLRGLRADIREFWLEKNAKLQSLDGFVGLAALPDAASGPSVRIEDQPELESLEGLFRSDHLRVQRLQLLASPKIVSVDLRSAIELDALVVRSCSALQEIRGVESIGAISQLHLTGLSALPRLPEFTNLQSVVDLELIDLPLLRNLEQLSTVMTVDRIAMSFMDSLSSLSGLENVLHAQRILVEDLLALENLDGLRGLQSVDTLWISDDDKLESLRGLSLRSALELAVRYNDKLKTLEGLEMLGEAGTLDVSENPVLVSVRALASLREATKVYARANSQLPQCELDWLARNLPQGSTSEFSDNGPAGICVDN